MKQKGFTLIELVVVIVLLGILAVVAAPKFLNLQSDAYRSTLHAMNGSFKSTNTIVYSKANIQDQAGKTGSVKLTSNDPDPIPVSNGYIATNISKEQFERVMDIDLTNDWEFITNPTIILIKQKNASNNCYLRYTNDGDSPPRYAVFDSQC